MKVNIISFEDHLAKKFAELNIAWLEKLFYVEAHDKEVLYNCKTEIILPGGKIFFAELNKEIIGTFALLKIDGNTFELTKMAVAESFRGHRIGQQMLNFLKEYVKNEGIAQVILYSNRSLENAIYLYKKYGFKEVVLEKNAPYQRADIKMEYQSHN